jgi:hypothetical protein
MFSTDADLQMYPDDEYTVVEVDTRQEATAKLVEDLYNTASDEFMDQALREWFAHGEIVQLQAGNDVYWNVRLIEG